MSETFKLTYDPSEAKKAFDELSKAIQQAQKIAEEMGKSGVKMSETIDKTGESAEGASKKLLTMEEAAKKYSIAVTEIATSSFESDGRIKDLAFTVDEYAKRLKQAGEQSHETGKDFGELSDSVDSAQSKAKQAETVLKALGFSGLGAIAGQSGEAIAKVQTIIEKIQALKGQSEAAKAALSQTGSAIGTTTSTLVKAGAVIGSVTATLYSMYSIWRDLNGVQDENDTILQKSGRTLGDYFSKFKSVTDTIAFGSDAAGAAMSGMAAANIDFIASEEERAKAETDAFRRAAEEGQRLTEISRKLAEGFTDTSTALSDIQGNEALAEQASNLETIKDVEDKIAVTLREVEEIRRREVTTLGDLGRKNEEVQEAQESAAASINALLQRRNEIQDKYKQQLADHIEREKEIDQEIEERSRKADADLRSAQERGQQAHREKLRQIKSEDDAQRQRDQEESQRHQEQLKSDLDSIKQRTAAKAGEDQATQSTLIRQPGQRGGGYPQGGGIGGVGYATQTPRGTAAVDPEFLGGLNPIAQQALIGKRGLGGGASGGGASGIEGIEGRGRNRVFSKQYGYTGGGGFGGIPFEGVPFEGVDFANGADPFGFAQYQGNARGRGVSRGDRRSQDFQVSENGIVNDAIGEAGKRNKRDEKKMIDDITRKRIENMRRENEIEAGRELDTDDTQYVSGKERSAYNKKLREGRREDKLERRRVARQVRGQDTGENDNGVAAADRQTDISGAQKDLVDKQIKELEGRKGVNEKTVELLKMQQQLNEKSEEETQRQDKELAGIKAALEALLGRKVGSSGQSANRSTNNRRARG